MVGSAGGIGEFQACAVPELIDFTHERERHRQFVGREDVLARLDQWLLGPDDTRWVVVTGGPEGRLLELLGRVSKQLGVSGRLVVVVDGLDETRAEPGENPLPRFLPHVVDRDRDCRRGRSRRGLVPRLAVARGQCKHSSRPSQP